MKNKCTFNGETKVVDGIMIAGQDFELPEGLEVENISDSYHTFKELYKARHILFINLCLQKKDMAFWTHKNKEGESWDGWFILGLQLEKEQLTFHLPITYLDHVKNIIPELERNSMYDGHGTEDVLKRLTALAKSEALLVFSG